MQARTAVGARGTARAVAVPRPGTATGARAGRQVGRNDSIASLEHLADLVSGGASRRPRSPGCSRRRSSRSRPDQGGPGSIGRATRTGIGARQAPPALDPQQDRRRSARRRPGDGHGDFDFFRVHAFARSTIAATTLGSALDSVLVVYAPHGRIVATNDDANDTTTTSALAYSVRAPGTTT